MAAKKKAKKVSAPAKKAAVKAPAARVAEKVLATLAPLDERRRRVYRAAFSDEQCLSWGSRTKAPQVLGEAERLVGSAAAVIKRGAITTYSPHRLAWLCHLVTDLSDSIARDQSTGIAEARIERAGATLLADKLRRRLVSGLLSVASGNAALAKEITDRNESSRTPHVLESTLTGLLQLAVSLRRSQDGELLCDDAGLTDAFLSSVSATIESLRESNEATYGEQTGRDSRHTNLVEGRVLREMAFLIAAFRNAKDGGETVGALPPSRLISQAANQEKDEIPDPAATPTA